MSEHENVAEFKLGTITRTVRVLAAAPPKLATRLSLGVVLALDDAYNNDPSSELLAMKLGAGAASIASTVGVIARAAGSNAMSASSSIRGALQSGVERLGSSGSRLQQVPVLNAAKEFVSEVAGEIRDTWDAAGYVNVQIVAEDPALEPTTVIESASILEGSEHSL